MQKTTASIHKPKIYGVEDYEQYIGAEAVERILKKAEPFRGSHVAHVNSAYYGGVAEILLSMTLLMSRAGIKTGWRTLQGSPDFFGITKKMHNALQGAGIDLSERKKQIYEETVYENSLRTHLDSHDFVMVHDPQPLPMIRCYEKKNVPWIWRCHADMSNPHRGLWEYLRGFIEEYDAAIFSIPEYRQKLQLPQHFFMPAIDPFSAKNRRLSNDELRDRFDHYKIPTDLPLVVQISRFDRWKDPAGVIDAFQIARKQTPCTLVLLGSVATDDPEGQEVFESLLRRREERIIVLSVEDTSLVNALQSKADIIVQKSIREGFGLTVTEAMWKGRPVIAGKTGGIPHQIKDGHNGFLVSSSKETAERIVELLKDEDLRRSFGERARETVQNQFLMTRLLEQELDLYAALSGKTAA